MLVCMDELTGFVYVTLLPDSESCTLAKHFMIFLLRLGLCSIVVVDAASLLVVSWVTLNRCAMPSTLPLSPLPSAIIRLCESRSSFGS